MRILPTNQWIGILVVSFITIALFVFLHVAPQKPRDSVSFDKDTIQTLSNTLNQNKKIYQKHDTIKIERSVFNPNTADSITLLKQGLRPWQVRNLIRYRSKGGKYRKPEDLKRLYGMTDSLYSLLEPYIDIPQHIIIDTDAIFKDTVPHYINYKKDTIIELNSADTTALKYLRGVGMYTAIQIIQYREQLGGYYSAEQIREIDYLKKSEHTDSIIAHLFVCTDSIHPIMVNYTSVERMQKHPYLRFEQAKALYTLRRQRIRLKSIDELKELNEFSEQDIDRLKYYLSFEK